MIAVIICDDHPATALSLARLLEAEAPDVKVVGIAFNGNDAEAMAGELSPHVVVMDIYMPGMTGIEATRRIKARCPETEVVMLTVSHLESDLVEALRAGATGYVTKDQGVDDIVSAVRAVHGGQLTVPAGLAGHILQGLTDEDSPVLTDEERKILRSVAEGMTNKQIGEGIHLSERTVRRRIRDIYAKLRMTDTRRAAAYAAQVASLYVTQAGVWSESARRRLESRQEKSINTPGTRGA